MPKEDVAKIVTQVLAEQQKKSMKSDNWGKTLAGLMGGLLAIGALYTSFFQPQTLAAAQVQAGALVKTHVTNIHEAQEKRLDRIENKIDQLLLGDK